ncbi:MAG: ribonucleoside-triphosphate reductase, partial [Bacilli bacterium]|nr:ribonucleoside-triphosphate reductase [Bacilli bacterium]
SHPDHKILLSLQRIFIDILDKEMERTPITFPVITACFSTNENNEIKDRNFLRFVAHRNEQWGQINIYAGKSSTLSSCCRLRSDTSNEYFNSFGAGTTKIGSLGVCTINLPRLAFVNNDKEKFLLELAKLVEVCSLVNRAKRRIIEERIKTGHHPLYDLGFLNLEKQYLTCGINGFNEAIELLGEDILTDKGTALGQEIIDTINNVNDAESKTYKMPFNCEQIPAENVAVKLAEKDMLLGYNDGRYKLYSNQFIPLTTKADLLDRIYLQGQFDSKFTGGAIMHCNCETRITWQQQMDLIETCVKNGVVYFAINYNLQECENGHMSVGKNGHCPICGKEIVNDYTRVVGFLTCVKNWHPTRRTIDYPNRKFYNEEGMRV